MTLTARRVPGATDQTFAELSFQQRPQTQSSGATQPPHPEESRVFPRPDVDPIGSDSLAGASLATVVRYNRQFRGGSTAPEATDDTTRTEAVRPSTRILKASAALGPLATTPPTITGQRPSGSGANTTTTSQRSHPNHAKPAQHRRKSGVGGVFARAFRRSH